MKFVLNGCDISFDAEAPEDITLKELLRQCDRIIPHYCACGIWSAEKAEREDCDTEIFITKDDVWKANDYVSCTIEPKEKPMDVDSAVSPEMRTAYFLDGDMNIYTTPVSNRREAIMLAEQHGQEFVGFLDSKSILEEIERRKNKNSL